MQLVQQEQDQHTARASDRRGNFTPECTTLAILVYFVETVESGIPEPVAESCRLAPQAGREPPIAEQRVAPVGFSEQSAGLKPESFVGKTLPVKKRGGAEQEQPDDLAGGSMPRRLAAQPRPLPAASVKRTRLTVVA